MTEELKIWAVEGAGKVTPVEQASHTETENLFEDMLVKNPGMLMPGLELVGRQTPTDGGPLDLLGVDTDGQLVVFELKRGELARDAVTQIIDYTSGLEAMGDDELTAHIAQRSGQHGIDEIEDFGDWYVQRFREQPLSSLKPIKMMLVGLGADARATRMVDFLADRGVHISLLTFHGYKHDGKTLLARQVRAEPEGTEAARGYRSREERCRAVNEFAKDQGVDEIFSEAVKEFLKVTPPCTQYIRKDGYTFYAEQPLRLPEHEKRFSTPLSLRITRDGKIRATFFPISVHLCKAEFQKAERSSLFKQERPPNAPRTNDVSEQWYCILDRSGWDTHKAKLLKLASDVSTAWNEAVQSVGPPAAQSADMAVDMD